MSYVAALGVLDDWRVRSLPSSARVLLAYIGDRQWSATGEAICSYESTARDLGWSRATVWRWYRFLRLRGLVEIVSKGGGRSRANSYRVTTAPRTPPPSSRPRNRRDPATPTTDGVIRDKWGRISKRVLLTPQQFFDPKRHRPKQKYDVPFEDRRVCGSCGASNGAGWIPAPSGGVVACPSCR